MESLNNLGYICQECADLRRSSWQEAHTHIYVNVGDFVKIQIWLNEGKDQEHMWAEITKELEPSEYLAVLRNDSVFNPDMSGGTVIGFNRSDIEDYCKQGDFSNWKPWKIPPDKTHIH